MMASTGDLMWYDYVYAAFVSSMLYQVMAGTGDLSVLRLCRYLRTRVGSPFGFVSYGSHMAIAMAIGLLFLGGGK